eukprot:jgi/Tetstr1/445367/TSEL_033165.t1
MTGVQWACKVITEDLGVSTSLEEVELMRQLSDHPNIVSYREHFFYGGRLHIIMEYVKGANLGDAITYRGSFAEEDAREVFRQLLSAVSYMHDRGIAHRDLKVENILVTDFDHTAVKLVDFGLAGRLRGNGDAFNVSCGTPTFVAPEVLQLDPSYGTSCDLWSLGCVLHVMLSGYLPFRAPSVPQLLALVRRGAREDSALVVDGLHEP